SSTGETDWIETNISGNNLIYSANFSQPELGKENWLVSPTFDVSDLSEGSLTFDLAYAQRNNTVDGLKILLSKDCGINWSEVIYNKRGSLLATVDEPVSGEWFPALETDWVTETIDLTEIINDVFTSQIRIAFVTTNGNGNNIFLDNIQLFDTQIPNLLEINGNMSVFPNPSTGLFFVAMDLPQREEIALSVIDISGKVVRRFDLMNVLNQRYEIDIPQTKGVYFVQAIGKNTNLTRRILIGR
ncbi:MAG: choice-of-anchor J domain-containing protein, partial [Bacteroidota bacterium]